MDKPTIEQLIEQAEALCPERKIFKFIPRMCESRYYDIHIVDCDYADNISHGEGETQEEALEDFIKNNS